MNEIIEFIQYPFIQNAVIAGSFTAMSCAALGIFLVLRKMSLIGDGLSHVSFGAIAFGLFLGVYPMYVAVPAALAASVAIAALSDRTKIYGDAAIGIISSAGLASGILFASLSGGSSADLMGYLFGSILSVSPVEVVFSILLSMVIIVLIAANYWDFFSLSFDQEYAAASGVRLKQKENLLALMTALTVVMSVKIVGAMLVSALLIIPAVTALQLARRFKEAIFISCISALTSLLVGITASYFFDLPAGSTIVIINMLLFILAFGYKKIAF